jgi:hypothetical protein
VAIILVYKERRLKIYFIYLGNEKLPIGNYIYLFHTPGDLSKYFRRTYLSNLSKNEQIECKIYSVILDYRMALQNHATTVHGTIS